MRSFLISCGLLGAVATAGNPHVDFAFGVLAERRGDDARAAELYESARVADPTAGPLVRRGVSRLLDEGNRSAAVAMFRDYAAARGDDPSVQLEYADFLVNQGRGDALAEKLAVETLDRVLASHPGSPPAVQRLASLVPDRAAELAASLADDDPAAAMLFASLSRGLHDGDDVEARAEVDRRFLKAVDAHPRDAALARRASEHFRTTKRTDEAIHVLRTHADAAPWSLDLRARLGVLLFTAGRDDEGRGELEKLLVIAPEHKLAHQALAKHFRKAGDDEMAMRHSAELLRIRGGDPDEFVKLADEFLAAEQPAKARILLEKAAFDHPDDFSILRALAIATRRDPATRSRAPRLFREAESLLAEGETPDPAFLSESAECLIEAGQSKAAEERLRSAIRAMPADAKQETATALRRLAGLWEAGNRNTAAAKALRQRADALDPP